LFLLETAGQGNALFQAANDTPGVSADILPATTPDEVQASVDLYCEYAERTGGLPESFAVTASAIIRRGGFLLRITADETSGDNGTPSTNGFYENLRRIRKVK
jgi:hypothetical protein